MFESWKQLNSKKHSNYSWFKAKHNFYEHRHAVDSFHEIHQTTDSHQTKPYCITVIMRKITANMITFEAVNHIPYLKLYLKSMRVICFVSSSVISYRPHWNTKSIRYLSSHIILVVDYPVNLMFMWKSSLIFYPSIQFDSGSKARSKPLTEDQINYSSFIYKTCVTNR